MWDSQESRGKIQMDSIRQEKVQRFEEFVDRRLKPDLVRAIAESSAQNLLITTQMQRIAGVATVAAGGARWVAGDRQWLGREKDEQGRDRLEWKGTQLSVPVDDVSRHHYFKQYLYVDLGVLASFWSDSA
ncbi:hypothetical protein RHMOL_Rhmol12G0084700 [Rhododendron molle]|uniref:Uncharacterized protein n=1 Tax=Rhododendron molle TaxID=49168 RepID=A0ACC0LHC7_RHOML|nr:hypothetical protein RHMOL_Rhmol12G0084700 [Rhododendron molle]